MLSVVVPAKNEKDNLAPLIGEIITALEGLTPFEIVYVDDGSTDGTFDELVRLKTSGLDCLVPLRHKYSVGQSTAVLTAVRHARGDLVATMDADGQNDPADLPNMLRAAQTFSPGQHFCIAGYRKCRKDTAWKRLQSRIANGVRSRLLRDGTPDTGCGLKVLPRSTYLALPYFDHMHRFIPALVQRLKGEVKVVEVNHRDRCAGTSNYNMWGRLRVGIPDMLGVMWLQRRMKLPEIEQAGE